MRPESFQFNNASKAYFKHIPCYELKGGFFYQFSFESQHIGRVDRLGYLKLIPFLPLPMCNNMIITKHTIFKGDSRRGGHFEGSWPERHRRAGCANK